MTNGQPDSLLKHVRKLVAKQALRNLSDRELLNCFIEQHDEAAFAALVERHGSMTLGVCRRVLRNEHDAEDACQASFLVLARKAGSIRKKDSISCWLHGVAFRVASDLKKRRKRLQTSGVVNEAPGRDTNGEVTLREAQTALDEELSALSECYRAPLVLCYLEGKTRDEAAQQLGWKLGTLRSRLERARELLRNRLVRRGVGPSVAMLSMVFADAATANMPAMLALSTAKAAPLLAIGRVIPASIVSPEVISLAEGVVKAMFLTELKISGVVALFVVAFGLAGVGTLPQPALAQKEPDKAAERTQESKNEELKKQVAAQTLEPADNQNAHAFRETQEALRKERSYSFKRTYGNGLTERVTVLDEFRSRRERNGGLGDEKSVTILDWKQERALVLDQKNKTAQLRTIYPTAEVLAELRDAVTQLSRVPERATRKIGEKRLDGVRVIEYGVKDEHGEQVVLVRADTNKPVRTEWVGLQGASPDAKIVDSDFAFGPKLDPSLFALTPPDGYTVISSIEPRGARANDASLRELVVSKLGIGIVRFGMSKARIVEILGEPDGVEKTTVLDERDPILEVPGNKIDLADKKLPAENMLYNSRGFHLIVSEKFGLSSVDCFGPPLSGMFVRGFLGKASDGLKMGTQRADVIKVLGGEPNVQMPVSRFGEEMLSYGFPDGSSIAFRLRSGLVCEISAGRYVKKAPDAGGQKKLKGKAADDGEQKESKKPASEASVVPEAGSSDEQYARMIAAYETEAESLKSQLRALQNAEQRQSESSKLLHLPEKYAEQLLKLSTAEPGSAAELKGYRWVIVNVVDLSHPSVKEAVARIAARHLQSNDLEEIILRARFGGVHCRKLLESILAVNRDRRMQGLACFAIGQNLMRQAVDVVFTPGQRDKGRFVVSSLEERKQLVLEAEQRFERVVDEFAHVEWRSRELGELASAYLKSLRSPVAIGKPAPEINAANDEGKKIKLSDFRGRVVVLQFSANWCSPCQAMYPKLRELVQEFSDQKVAVLSVMADSAIDTVRNARKGGKITWPAWHDGMDGPIAAAWGIDSYPSVFLIDSDGTIVSRSHNLDLDVIRRLARGISDKPGR